MMSGCLSFCDVIATGVRGCRDTLSIRNMRTIEVAKSCSALYCSHKQQS